MTYGSEVWTITKHTRTKLMTAEMDFWRRLARVSRCEKIRNEVIKDRMNVKNVIVDFIETKSYNGMDTQKEWHRNCLLYTSRCV